MSVRRRGWDEDEPLENNEDVNAPPAAAHHHNDNAGNFAPNQIIPNQGYGGGFHAGPQQSHDYDMGIIDHQYHPDTGPGNAEIPFEEEVQEGIIYKQKYAGNNNVNQIQSPNFRRGAGGRESFDTSPGARSNDPNNIDPISQQQTYYSAHGGPGFSGIQHQQDGSNFIHPQDHGPNLDASYGSTRDDPTGPPGGYVTQGHYSSGRDDYYQNNSPDEELTNTGNFSRRSFENNNSGGMGLVQGQLGNNMGTNNNLRPNNFDPDFPMAQDSSFHADYHGPSGQNQFGENPMANSGMYASDGYCGSLDASSPRDMNQHQQDTNQDYAQGGYFSNNMSASQSSNFAMGGIGMGTPGADGLEQGTSVRQYLNQRMQQPLLAASLQQTQEEYNAVSNVDDFLCTLYKYYESKGLHGRTAEIISHLTALGFTIIFSIMCVFCIDWEDILKCQDEESCAKVHFFYDNPFIELSFLKLIALFYFMLAGLFFVYSFFKGWDDLRQCVEVAGYFFTILTFDGHYYDQVFM